MHASFLPDLYQECRYEDLLCIRNKISSIFFLSCKQETKYNTSDVTLWKNIKCIMLILFFIHDTHKNLNKYIPAKYLRNLCGTQAYLNLQSFFQ